MPHKYGGTYRDPKTGRFTTGVAAHAKKSNPGRKKKKPKKMVY